MLSRPELHRVAMSDTQARKPGDIILDRYCPNLSPDDREIARERLRAWMRWTLQIIMRQVREERARGDSTRSVEGGKIPLTPS